MLWLLLQVIVAAEAAAVTAVLVRAPRWGLPKQMFYADDRVKFELFDCAKKDIRTKAESPLDECRVAEAAMSSRNRYYSHAADQLVSFADNIFCYCLLATHCESSGLDAR